MNMPPKNLFPQSDDAAGASVRPSRSHPEILPAVIAKIAADCAEWERDTSPGNITEWEKCFERINLNQNGYQIARTLDREFLVEADAELVEILDRASSLLWSEYDNVVRQWVAENAIAPTLSIGQFITSKHGEGPITGIEHASGRYMFVPKGEEERFRTGGGVLVEYEHATLVTDVQEAQ